MSIVFVADSNAVPLFAVTQWEDGIEFTYKPEIPFQSVCRVIPYKKASVATVLHNLLYKNLFDGDISEGDRKRLIDAIEKIYFNQYCSPQDSFELLQSSKEGEKLHLAYTFRKKADYIAGDIMEQIRRKIEASGDRGSEIPNFVTYEDRLKACHQFQVKIPRRRYLAFDSGQDLLAWFLETMVLAGKQVKKCACCNSYFIPNHLETIYCSNPCRRQSQAESRFCGCTDLWNRFQQTYQALRRKTVSNREYRYNPEQFEVPNGIDKLVLLRDFSHLSPYELKRKVFTKKDFALMKKRFKAENKEKCKAFRHAYDSMASGSGSGSEFEQAKTHYMEWLTAVRDQLRCFEA